MEADEAKRLKELERENSELKKMPGATRDTSVGCDQSEIRNLLMVNVLWFSRLRVGFAHGRTTPLWDPLHFGYDLG